jgi:hypothetical protein
VILDAKLHMKAKRFALLNDISLTDLVTSLLQNHLDSNPES